MVERGAVPPRRHVACAYAKVSGGFIGRQSFQRTGWHPTESPQLSGGFIGGVPPVPIPNTAVKPSRADGTARFPCGRVGRCRNFFPDAPPRLYAPRGVAFWEPLWESVSNQICASDQPPSTPSTPRRKRRLEESSFG